MAKEVSEKKSCYFCNSVENEVRIIGGFVVELREMDHKGNTVLACQSCIRKTVSYEKNLKDASSKSKFRFLGFKK